MLCRIKAPDAVSAYEKKASFCREQKIPLPAKPFVVEHHGKEVDVMNCWEKNGFRYCAIQAPFINEYEIVSPDYLRY